MKQYSFILESLNLYHKNGIQLYHLSQLNLDGEILKPRIPKSAGTFKLDDNDRLIFDGNQTKEAKKVSEDSKTPRVCFGRSIKGCLNAVPNTRTRKVWFVHVPVSINPKYLKFIGFEEVPDSESTHEIWYTKPVKVKCIGMICVDSIKWNSGSLTKHGFPRIDAEYHKISNSYDPPYNFYQVKEFYGKDILKKMCGCYMDDKKGWQPNKDQTPNQAAHYWRCLTGLELTHKEPTLAEQKRTWKNWNFMSPNMKKMSDKKSLELFGVINKKHFEELIQRTDYNDYKTGQLEIDFPKEEIPVLSKQKKFVTTRVSDDYNKYWYGDIVMTPWGKRYKIVKRLNITDIKDHPYYKELTKDQIKFLSKFNEICVLWGEQI